MKLLASAATIALLAGQPASASLITISAFDDGVLVASTSAATGFALLSASDPLFDLITISATGDPITPQPDLGSTTIDVSTDARYRGTHTLVLDVLQIGLNSGPADTLTTGTFNGLLGAPGPAVEDMLVDGVIVASHTFAASSGAFGYGPIAASIAGASSDEQRYTVTFTAPLQEFSGSMQFVVAEAPEPTSLSLLLGALGLGLVGMWFSSRMSASRVAHGWTRTEADVRYARSRA